MGRIGNSRGVRLPAATLARYHIGDCVVMEERSEGILLRPRGSTSVKLSWAETAREMSDASEDWSDWDHTIADGLQDVQWEGELEPRKRRSIAESEPKYRTPTKRNRKR